MPAIYADKSETYCSLRHGNGFIYIEDFSLHACRSGGFGIIFIPPKCTSDLPAWGLPPRLYLHPFEGGQRNFVAVMVPTMVIAAPGCPLDLHAIVASGFGELADSG